MFFRDIRKKGVKYFRGSEINKIKRWAECAEKFKLQSFHTIDADDPFFDGDEVKKSMNLLNKKNTILFFHLKSHQMDSQVLASRLNQRLSPNYTKSILEILTLSIFGNLSMTSPH